MPERLCQVRDNRQWNAIKRRQMFIEVEGVAAATLLDFFLDADRGRADLMRLMKIPAAQIERTVEDLLRKLCVHFGNIRRTA